MAEAWAIAASTAEDSQMRRNVAFASQSIAQHESPTSSDTVSPGSSSCCHLREQIAKDFCDEAKLKNAFVETCEQCFGSSWVWLCYQKDHKRLSFHITRDQAAPQDTDSVPLLACDMWEHAYLGFDSIEQYCNSFWRSVNWNFVERNLTSALMRPKL